MLAYGAFLFWSKTEIKTAIRDVQYNQKIYFPSQISEYMEHELVARLAKEQHPVMDVIAQAKWRFLNTAFIHKVEKGKQGWQFLKEETLGRPSALQSIGQYQYAPLELLRWELLLRQRANWCASKGMDYVWIIAPNKSTVYPELLPNRYQVVGPTSTDRLIERISDLNVIDLRGCLLAEKERTDAPLYLRTDTHWNALGAYAGYRCMMEQLPEPYRASPLPISAFAKKDTLRAGGDIARMLLRQDREPDYVPILRLKQPTAVFQEALSEPWPPYPRPYHYTIPDTTRPAAVFDHDSFIQRMWGYLPEHFSKGTYMWGWQGFARPVVEKHQPDLVVDEFVERSLIGDRPRNDWGLIQLYWKERFETLDTLPKRSMRLSEVLPYLHTRPAVKDAIMVAALRFEPEQEEKLRVTYDDNTGWYTLPDWGITYYLEFEGSNIRKLELEANPLDIEVEVQVGYLSGGE